MQTGMHTKQYEISNRNRKCKPKCNKSTSIQNSMQLVNRKSGISNANQIPNQFSITNSNSKMQTFEDHCGSFASLPGPKGQNL